MIKSGSLSDGPNQEQKIGSEETVWFEWTFKTGPLESTSSMLQSDKYPKIEREFYLEPIAYQLKEVPYEVEILKNVTIYPQDGKLIVEKQVYKNKFFGYSQFFYLGY